MVVWLQQTASISGSDQNIPEHAMYAEVFVPCFLNITWKRFWARVKVEGFWAKAWRLSFMSVFYQKQGLKATFSERIVVLVYICVKKVMKL